MAVATFTRLSQRIPPIDYTCEGCEKKFKARQDSARRFCSRKCYQKWSHNRGWIEKDCERCGKRFGVWRSKDTRFGRRKYCSKTCYWLRLVGNKYVKDAMKRRWSWRFARCVECKTTSVPHYSKGRCRNCDSRMRARKKRGSWKKACLICGEYRVIDTAHIVPRVLIGERWDKWLVLYLCPTHHKLYDTGRLHVREWRRIESRVRAALARLRTEGRDARLLGRRVILGA